MNILAREAGNRQAGQWRAEAWTGRGIQPRYFWRAPAWYRVTTAILYGWRWRRI